jgi:hypothetical protein
MNRPDTLARSVAIALIHFAIRLIPRTRITWAQGMLSELQYVHGDGKAVQWAFGCLITGIKLRINIMITRNLKIARWIFLPEILLCFVPLSIAWRDSIFGGSGVIRLNGDLIHRYFIGVPGGELVLLWMISTAILGALGPVGLIAGFLAVLGRPLRTRWLCTALVIGPILYGVLVVISRFAVAGPAASFTEVDFWRALVLLSALPALGAAHMFRSGLGSKVDQVAA